jgi:hypothetical protein
MRIAKMLVIRKGNFICDFAPDGDFHAFINAKFIGGLSLVNNGHDEQALVTLVNTIATGTHFYDHGLHNLTITCLSSKRLLILMKVPVVLAISLMKNSPSENSMRA